MRGIHSRLNTLWIWTWGWKAVAGVLWEDIPFGLRAGSRLLRARLF